MDIQYSPSYHPLVNRYRRAAAMCTRYRASRADIEAFARRAGIGFAEALRYFELEHDTWKSDVWPDYPAPTLLPAGDGAQAVMGRYGFLSLIHI